jgi:ADP-heptose:LPS heptosyltransferase
MAESILIIKHGAFGDFIQSLGAFAAIRAHNIGARITLLTTRPWVQLAEAAPWFDAVWTDDRRGGRRSLWATVNRIRAARFDYVFDLQNSDRTALYFWLLWPRNRQWSGLVRGCSHPHRTPHRPLLHTLERLREQLFLAGIDPMPDPGLDWLTTSTPPVVPGPFALLVPGGSPHRPEKRWPGERYAALAAYLVTCGLTPVIIGTRADQDNIAPILATVPQAIDLSERTSFADLADLSRRAAFAVGNDTGPMHLMAVAGCAVRVLFSHASDPKRCAPKGRDVAVLRVPDLRDLTLDTVLASLPLSPPHGLSFADSLPPV